MFIDAIAILLCFTMMVTLSALVVVGMPKPELDPDLDLEKPVWGYGRKCIYCGKPTHLMTANGVMCLNDGCPVAWIELTEEDGVTEVEASPDGKRSWNYSHEGWLWVSAKEAS